MRVGARGLQRIAIGEELRGAEEVWALLRGAAMRGSLVVKLGAHGSSYHQVIYRISWRQKPYAPVELCIYRGAGEFSRSRTFDDKNLTDAVAAAPHYIVHTDDLRPARHAAIEVGKATAAALRAWISPEPHSSKNHAGDNPVKTSS